MNRSKFVVLVIAILALAGVATSASAQDLTPVPSMPAPADFPTNTLTVTGIGMAAGEPDIAYIDLGVETMDASIATAFATAADTMQNVISALSEAGIAREDIRTSAVNIYPQDNYDPQTGQPTDRTYRVSNTLHVTVRDVTMVETVINTAVNAGANSIYNFAFGIEDTAALEEQARQAAVANARLRADQLAAALGVTVGRPVVITESYGGNPVPPIPYGYGGAAMDVAQSSLPVETGQLNVTVQILVTYSIQ